MFLPWNTGTRMYHLPVFCLLVTQKCTVFSTVPFLPDPVREDGEDALMTRVSTWPHGYWVSERFSGMKNYNGVTHNPKLYTWNLLVYLSSVSCYNEFDTRVCGDVVNPRNSLYVWVSEGKSSLDYLVLEISTPRSFNTNLFRRSVSLVGRSNRALTPHRTLLPENHDFDLSGPVRLYWTNGIEVY